MNEAEARQIVARLTSSFPHARLAADNIAAYIAWIVRQDYSVAADAVIALVGSLKRWPTLADFDEACREVQSRRRMARELNASHEWGALTAAERESGKARVAELVTTLHKAHSLTQAASVPTASRMMRAARGSGRKYAVDPKTGTAAVQP